MTDDDYKQKIRDGVEDILAAVASGEMSAEEAERELEVCKALNELVLIFVEMNEREPATSHEEKMRQDAKLIALWPEACRRAGVPVIDLPADIMRRIVSVAGRPS